MITTIKTTKIILDHIERIEDEEPKEIFEGYSRRCLTLTTKEGEKYELVFEAEKPEQLYFKFPGGWIAPKLYNGQSVHEEELESSNNL